jgi:hypothetical protein
MMLKVTEITCSNLVQFIFIWQEYSVFRSRQRPAQRTENVEDEECTNLRNHIFQSCNVGTTVGIDISGVDFFLLVH